MTRRGLFFLLVAGIAALLPSFPFADNFRTVIRIVDGDTIVLDGKEKVRRMGVDTTESVDVAGQ